MFLVKSSHFLIDLMFLLRIFFLISHISFLYVPITSQVLKMEPSDWSKQQFSEFVWTSVWKKRISIQTIKISSIQAYDNPRGHEIFSPKTKNETSYYRYNKRKCQITLILPKIHSFMSIYELYPLVFFYWRRSQLCVMAAWC